jgi:hypothetical protein
VLAALSEYLASSGGLRLESSRERDELTITFRLTEAEHYQQLLAHLTDPNATAL